MKVLAHRGYWNVPEEKNTPAAFVRAFDAGFGIETDIRDCAGKLVVSHDMPCGNEFGLAELLELASAREVCLALNVKSDGLARSVQDMLQNYAVTNVYFFDMSVPDMESYFDCGLPLYTRMSEYERLPSHLARAEGVWLDAFRTLWYDAELIASLLGTGKRVCVVSPELHGRAYESAWEQLRASAVAECTGLMLCTDEPDQAREYFKCR